MTAPEAQVKRPGAPRRRRWLLALAGFVVIAAALTAVILFNAPPSAPAPPRPTGVADVVDDGDQDDAVSTEPLTIDEPTPEPLSRSEDDEAQRAESTAVAVVEVTNEIAQRGDGSAVGADQIATGFVLGELEAAAQAQKDLGYRQVGEAKVTQTTASDIDLSVDPPTMTLTVCVDVSDIDVLDETGKSLKASLYNPGRPVKHVYGAVFQDDVWKLATHEIPDDQDCPLP